MKDLKLILQKYSKRLVIHATTLDKSTIEFETYEELLDYENYGKSRIRELRITGYAEELWDKVFELTFYPNYSIKLSFGCTYCFMTSDEETLFLKDIKGFLSKCSHLYPISLIGNVALLFLEGFLMFMLVTRIGLNFEKNSTGAIAGGLTALIHTVITYNFWYVLFPPVSFSWGEAINHYRRIKNVRNTIFGVIILGLVVNGLSKVIFG